MTFYGHAKGAGHLVTGPGGDTSGLGGGALLRSLSDPYRNHGGNAPASLRDVRDPAASGGLIDHIGEGGAHLPRAEFLSLLGHDTSVTQGSLMYTRVHQCYSKGEGMTQPRTLPAHAKCLHRKYALSCRDYEQMLADCGNCCEICRRPAAHNTAQKLFIDHDDSVGIWAVRGLLCHPCNSYIADKPWRIQLPEAAERYLSDPWYRRRLTELGVTLAPPNEPGDGARVRDSHGRIWRLTWMGWRCSDGRAKSRTWTQLVEQYGPIGLAVM